MRESLENLKKENGITLVALVITVVVMLILAGVAISAIVDGDGLFNRTRQATESYEDAARDEADQIKTLMNEIDKYLGNVNNEDDEDDNPPAGGATIGEIVDENKTFDGQTTGTYNNPIIPKGFAPVENGQDSTITVGAEWGSAEGYKYGLVIEDGIGNQFVWVPVDGTTVKFARYDFGKGLAFSSCSETVPSEITESVTNNQGFYIARFEAGQKVNGRIVSKKGAKAIVNVNWTTANTNASAMYSNGNTNYGAVSTLIYGTQWDTTLRFISAYDVGEVGYDIYATNSIGMGNYVGTSGADDIASTSEPAVCGAREGFRQKNIYDMAGNVWEWTMEKLNTNRIFRGGDYLYSASESSASFRDACGCNDASFHPLDGFRVALYIKQP